MSEPTSFALVESHTFHRPLDIRAHAYLPEGKTAWTDVKRSCEKSQDQVAYDQIAHHHAQGEKCNAQCMVFLGQGAADAQQRA